MPRCVGIYDHMNKTDKLKLELSIEELAGRLERMNYGTQRLLSALVKLRREDREINAEPLCKMLTNGIEELLNKGGF